MTKKLCLLFAFLLSAMTLVAQDVTLKGAVFGYKGDKIKILKKVQKNVSFEGPLSNITVSLIKGDVIGKTITDIGGNFTMKVPGPGKYRLVFSKQGYSIVNFGLTVGQKLKASTFEGFYILLKAEDESSAYIGSYNLTSEGVSFYPSNPDPDPASEEVLANNITFASKAASAMNTKSHQSKRNQSDPKVIRVVDTVKMETEKDTVKDTVLVDQPPILRRLDQLLRADIEDLHSDEWKSFIDSARIALASMDTSTSEYKTLIEKVNYAEKKLEDSNKIVKLKDEELDATKRAMKYMWLFVGVLVLFLGLLGYFFLQRRKHATQLQKQNDEISMVNSKILSSIRYAGVIQESFLQSPDKFSSLFTQSFIYNRPKDTVSGDFYWFGHHMGHKIVVAADCTGHGVPGAMLTVLGHSALNEIIYTDNVTSPGKILKMLNDRVLNTFDKSEDGYMPHSMDISIVSMKDGASEVSYSGAMNGIFHINGNDVKRHDVVSKSIGYDITAEDLTDKTLKVAKGDTIVMCSDGFYDQFKGDTDKIEKYNLPRFESLITTISKNNIDRAADHLDKEFMGWKGDRDQLDDVLVVGFKI